VQAVVGDAGVPFKADQQDIGVLEVPVRHFSVEVEVVQTARHIDRDLQALCPGQRRTSPSWSICTLLL
jgi:hypothetical protein